ncbi:hypothetical protein Tco_1407722 [Tanacetum coccineum]
MVWSGYAVLMSGKTDSIKLNNIPGCLPGSTFVYSEGLEVGSIWRIQGIEYDVLEFLEARIHRIFLDGYGVLIKKPSLWITQTEDSTDEDIPEFKFLKPKTKGKASSSTACCDDTSDQADMSKSSKSQAETLKSPFLDSSDEDIPNSFKSQVKTSKVETDDPFVDYDEIVGDYANTKKEIIVHVGNNFIVKNVVDCDMLYETKRVGPMGNFKEVNVDTDNETEKESVKSDTEENDTSGNDSEDLNYDPKHDEVFDDDEQILDVPRNLGLDGCFLSGPFPGQILTTVEVDANNGIYPIAYAIVEAKIIFDAITKANTDCIVNWNGGYLYQVTGPYRDQCVVNMDRRMCSCRKWELTRIPCHNKKGCKGQGGASQAGGSSQQSQGEKQVVGARNVSSQAAGSSQHSQAPRQAAGAMNALSQAGGSSQLKKDQYKVLVQGMPQVKLMVLVNLVQHHAKQAKDQVNIV